MEPCYKRVLLKLSGEALAGENGILNGKFLEEIAGVIAECVKSGVQIAMVIGGGNIWRGARQGGLRIDRVRADQMGMLSTVINSLAMQDYLLAAGVGCTVMSAFNISQVCKPYSQYDAIDLLEKGNVVIVSGGVGYPFFSTDSGMMLRAAELKCDAVLSAKNIDGVYDKDPRTNPDAKKYDTLTYSRIIADNLAAIDMSAAAIARDTGLYTVLFALDSADSIRDAVCGKAKGTVITK